MTAQTVSEASRKRLVIWCPCEHKIEGETQGVLMSRLGAHLYSAHNVSSLEAALLGAYLVGMVYGDVSDLKVLIVRKDEFAQSPGGR